MAHLTLLGAGKALAIAGGATTTFNPSSKSSSITLSGGDLVATSTADGEGINVAAIASSSTGKKYCEFTATVVSGSSTSLGAGLVNGSFTVGAAGLYLGEDNNGIGYYGDGSVYRNAGSVATIATFAQGNVIGMAVDLDGDLVWFRVGAGNWNNNVAYSPVTGVGGIDTSALGNVALFALVEIEGTTEAFTANFGATGYANAAPSGYGNW